jgi:EAL domain-containing protein (putative c-di-GMP-specific phosphodiesterase class I)
MTMTNDFPTDQPISFEGSPQNTANDLPCTQSIAELKHFQGDLDFQFSFAFQPIVNARTREIISFEALVRGPQGQPSEDVLQHVYDENVFQFDQTCHRKAIHLASKLKIRHGLHLNLFPHAIYQTGMSIRATLQASLKYKFDTEDIIFELIETQKLANNRQLIDLVRMYHEFGFQTAIDDFGSGYSGLNLLVEYQPNFIKFDRNLICNIHNDPVRQTVVQGILAICAKLQIQVLAEGVETVEEFDWLRRANVDLFQGYYFALPAFEALPDVASEVFRV